MRLATGVIDNRTVFGPVVGDELCDLGADGRWSRLADTLGAAQRADVERAAIRAPHLPIAELMWVPPVPRPNRILCVGLNYSDHAAESDRAHGPLPSSPTIFTRFPSSLVGHGAPLVRPTASASFDYEGELAVIIGETVRAVPHEHALRAVAGYSCLMEGTVRDFQRHTSQFIPGKNFDRSGAFGPWIVTADEFDLDSATLTTRVNGETLQKAQVNEMLHSVAALVAYCSTFTTLEPGDVIATGTPGGVGYARRPPRWLVPGDIVEVEVSTIGILSNPVVAEQ
jgi:2-keto-4-pentenoate hydratase/2-oxohepta-3-ene-1,7-dioic acid hydratase in catechol pathway